jgi:ubiquinone biosynthesis protein
VPLVRRLVPSPTPGPQRLRRLLEELGGTFIKFGQVLALQPDVLPRRYRDALFDLMDRVPAFDYSEVETVFRRSFGSAPTEAFDSFGETPIASASIGQVHVAYLEGRKLAVKVQRPLAHRDFGGDIRLMRWAAAAIRRLRWRRYDWVAMALEEFVSWSAEELDYRHEARFMDRLRETSRDRETARVPEVIWPLTTATILTAEYLEGTTLLEFFRSLEEGRFEVWEALERQGFEPERFAANAQENFLHDVFHHGVFHSDLHPANLLILPDNAVGYVDFGISGVISEFARGRLVTTVMALARADMPTVTEHLLAIAVLEADSDTDGFRRGLEELGDEWFLHRPGGGFERRKSYTEILVDTLRLGRRCRVMPHPEAVRYMRSVITLDGLIDRFAPGLDRDETLESCSSDLVETTGLSTLLSFDQWVDWLWTGRNLARDGARRLDHTLDRLERRLTPRRQGEGGRAGGDGGGGARALAFGATALATALLVVLLDEPPVLGLNLFTAQLAICAGAIGLLALELVGWQTSKR